jgi:hypothetical protein
MKPGDRLLQIWLTAGLFLSVGGVLPAAGAASGYLPRTGPPPLRFRPAPIVSIIASQPVTTASEPVPAASEAAPIQGPELPAELEFPPTDHPPQVPNPNGESLLPPVVPNLQPVQQPTPANELLIISPQMLIEYFRPQPGATNAPVSAIVPVQFMPATPAAAPSSRAMYKN